MNSIGRFLKTTILGGLFVLLPLLLLSLLLAEALNLVVALATPIADLFPKGTFDRVNFPVLIALLLILAVSFLLGLALLSEKGKRLGGWLEGKVLGRLPAYNFLKSLTAGFEGDRGGKGIRPALLHSSEGVREIVYVIEEHGNEQLTVLVPWAPTPFAGSVKIVSRDQVEMLEASMGDTTMVLSHLGMGAGDLLGKGGSHPGSASGIS